MLQKNQALVFLRSDVSSPLKMHISLSRWYFSLSWNQLGDVTGEKLAAAFEVNQSLKYLNIVGNDIHPRTATSIIEASLILDSNPIDLDIESDPPRSRQEIVSSYRARSKEAEERDKGSATLESTPQQTPRVV
jgi:hypothetical protein